MSHNLPPCRMTTCPDETNRDFIAANEGTGSMKLTAKLAACTNLLDKAEYQRGQALPVHICPLALLGVQNA